jgi:hypothetical protein
MRVMARVCMPVEAGNKSVREGRLPATIQRTAERWKPEAMYFTTFDGRRTAFMVFDMPESADLPAFAEPLFQELGAEVVLAPVMTGDDLERGLSRLG